MLLLLSADSGFFVIVSSFVNMLRGFVLFALFALATCNFYRSSEDDPFSPFQTPCCWGNEQPSDTNHCVVCDDDSSGAETHKASYDPLVLPSGVIEVDASSGSSPLDLPTPHAFHGKFGFGISGGHDGFFGLGGIFGLPQQPARSPWWKGENVCIEREETTDDEDSTENKSNAFSTSIRQSSCFLTPNKYECKTKIFNHGVMKIFVVRYKCCHGFEKREGSSGCNVKLELKPLLETLDQLNGTTFREALEGQVNLSEQNYTIFMPTDASLQEYEDKNKETNDIKERMSNDEPVPISSLALNHVVEDIYDMNDLDNEATIASLNNNQSIRINHYLGDNFGRITTANCVQVRKANNRAQNGVVHVIEGVIQTSDKTVLDVIRENPNLSSLWTAIEKTNAKEWLKDDGHFTIFAPVNKAFDKLPKKTMEKMVQGGACVTNILKHHILGHTVCSLGISENASTENIVGETLSLSKSVWGLAVENLAKIETSDIIASNGVIHLVDTVLIPPNALDINDALEHNNMTKFHDLIKSADFELQTDSLENVTLFVPSNEAFATQETKAILDKIGEDQEKLREFIQYHTVKGVLPSYNMINNAILPTNNPNNDTVRINLYSTMPIFTNILNRATVNCARILSSNVKSCGSVIHLIDRVLVPTEKTILEILREDGNFSTLLQVINGTDAEKILGDSNQSVSLAAPDNAAFESIAKADLTTLLEDKVKANEVIKNHILTEVLCCSGIGPQTLAFNSLVPTFSSSQQQIFNSGNNHIRIGRASVKKCDNIASNGVIHTINTVLYPQRPYYPHLNLFFDF